MHHGGEGGHGLAVRKGFGAGFAGQGLRLQLVANDLVAAIDGDDHVVALHFDLPEGVPLTNGGDGFDEGSIKAGTFVAADAAGPGFEDEFYGCALSLPAEDLPRSAPDAGHWLCFC